jgi:two-component system chemotaxis response regulator CheB
VLGASWGGLQALSTIVRGLPPDLPAAVVVVQHRSKDSGALLAELLQDVTPLRVVDVEDKEPIVVGHAYVAPPDYHLLVDDGVFSLSVDAAFRYSRPSIDVTMTSAADAYGDHVVAVVLTGANDDGSRGARYVVERGGAVLVQDPATAEVRTMPDGAIRALGTAPQARWAIVPLDKIAARLVELVAGAVGVAGRAS